MTPQDLIAGAAVAFVFVCYRIANSVGNYLIDRAENEKRITDARVEQTRADTDDIRLSISLAKEKGK